MATMDQGWSWVVLVASFSISGLLFGLSKCAGILYTVLPQMFGISRSQAATITTLFSGLMCGFGIISGMLLKYISIRKIVVLAGVLSSLGLCISALAKTSSMFLLGYGIVLAIGGGLSIVPSRMVLMEYFDKKRNLAIGLSLTGSCVGGICLPPLMERLQVRYGISGTLFIFSGLLLNIIPAALTFFPRAKNPKPKPREIKINTITSKLSLKPQQTKQKKCSCPLDFSVLTHFHFTAISASTCCAIAGFSAINIALPDFSMSELNVSRSQAALLLSGLSTGDLLGRMFISVFNAKFHLKHSYMIGLVFCAILILSVAFMPSYWTLFACACAYGLVSGTTNVTPNLLINEYIEPKKWAPAFALNTMFASIPIMATAPLIAVLRETFGSYVQCFYIASLVSLCAILPWCLESIVQWKKKKEVYWLTKETRERLRHTPHRSEVALRSIF
uniref:Major facilitator superfamily (MFS) profile domain-containing protein n=1 Tax=Strigamia maritima TaxID=126957 RepID=T1J6J1_STRMM